MTIKNTEILPEKLGNYKNSVTKSCSIAYGSELSDLNEQDPEGALFITKAVYLSLIENNPKLAALDKEDNSFSIIINEEPTGLELIDDEGIRVEIIKTIAGGGFAIVNPELLGFLKWLRIPNRDRGGH